jgi:hypothetical protein
MSFSPQLFLTNIKSHNGPAKPSRFEVIIPIPPYINQFVGNSVLEKILNFPNSIIGDVTGAINSALNRKPADEYSQTSNASTTRYFHIVTEEQLSTTGGSTYTQFRTDAVYRDASAWYHFVVVFDSTNATSTDRIKMYVNGTSLTCEAGQYIAPGLNTTAFVNTAIGHRIGNDQNLGIYLNGYMTEINFIDGQALTPSSFGMTDPITGVWEPLKYSGTYGTNGFYLNFKDATSTTTLGLDYSGNSNTWTTNNFSVTAGVGNDSLTDVPTPWIVYNTTGDVGGVVRGNYCTWNPLRPNAAMSYANGNLDATSNGGSGRSGYGTFGMSSGKWYFETTGGDNSVGVATINESVYANYAAAGSYNINGTTISGKASYITTDVISVAYDANANTIEFFKNGSSQGSTSFSAGAGQDVVAQFNGTFSATRTCVANFGQRPFAYTPPSGFLSLCTTNLPASTVLKGSEYMNAVLYTGNGGTQTVTGVGFQPDFTWIKSRSGADNHNLFNAVVGLPNRLFSNLTNAENTTAGTLTSFNSDGFSVGSISDVNANAVTFVGWNWKANGAGVSNTAGTITSTVSANTISGFSIITYTGNGIDGATVGHGLGVAPSMIIIKNRTDSASAFWCVYHRSAFVSGADPNVLYLNSTQAQTDDTNVWGSSPDFNSTTFKLGDYNGSNGSGDSLVAYCWAPIAGFSAFGSYTGNGSTDGPFVYLGFRPRFILIKRSSDIDDWFMYDTARSPYNPMNFVLSPNSSAADTATTNPDDLSNGFKLRSTSGGTNASGSTYIYACFAENPFKNALAR